MISLVDGRKELYQWDTNVSVTVPKDCTQVHFSNNVYGRSLDVDVIDGVAIIPDVLLQTDKDLNAWAFVGKAENGYTKISKIFKVNKRNKPADYVYTPVEQVTIAEIAAIAQSVRDDADAGMFDGYTPKKGVDYFTKADKQEIAESVDIPETLPNPHKLIFRGAVTAEYDGSKTVTVSVPAGGGGSGTGADGKSAYEIWLEQGNAGTEEDFLDSLKGEKGDTGEAGYTPQKGVDYFTDADKQEFAESVEIPETLPNPHKLIFTGAVTAEYDGSEDITVDVPAGGGSAVPFTNVKMTKIVHQTISKDTDGTYPQYVSITEDENGNPLELTAFAVRSDIRCAAYSYTKFGITPIVGNRQAAKGAYEIPKTHGVDVGLTIVVINKDGNILVLSPGMVGYHAESSHYAIPEYKVRELYFPSGGGISSGTYVEVWKLEIDE